MRIIPVDADRFCAGIIGCLELFQVMDFDDDTKPAVDKRTGLNVYRLRVLHRDPDESETRRPEIVDIKIVAARKPRFDPGVIPHIGGLSAMQWENNGRSGIAWSAQNVDFGPTGVREEVAA